MRAVIEIGLEDFDTDDIKEYLEDMGYFVVVEGRDDIPKILKYLSEYGLFLSKNYDNESFSFQKSLINEIIENAVNKYGYNKVIERLERVF